MSFDNLDISGSQQNYDLNFVGVEGGAYADGFPQGVAEQLQNTPSIGQRFKTALHDFNDKIHLRAEGDDFENATEYEKAAEKVDRFVTGAFSGLWQICKGAAKSTWSIVKLPLVGIVLSSSAEGRSEMGRVAIGLNSNIKDKFATLGKTDRGAILDDLTSESGMEMNWPDFITTCYSVDSNGKVEVNDNSKYLISQRNAAEFHIIISKVTDEDGITHLEDLETSDLARLQLIKDKVVNRNDLNGYLDNSNFTNSNIWSEGQKKAIDSMLNKTNEKGKPLDKGEIAKLNKLKDKYMDQFVNHKGAAGTINLIYEAIGGMQQVDNVGGYTNLEGEHFEFHSSAQIAKAEESGYPIVEPRDRKVLREISKKLTEGKEITDGDIAKLDKVYYRYTDTSQLKGRKNFLKYVHDLSSGIKIDSGMAQNYPQGNVQLLSKSEMKRIDEIKKKLDNDKEVDQSDIDAVVKMKENQETRKIRHETCKRNLSSLQDGPHFDDNLGYMGKHVFEQKEKDFFKKITQKLNDPNHYGPITEKEELKLNAIFNNYLGGKRPCLLDRRNAAPDKVERLKDAGLDTSKLSYPIDVDTLNGIDDALACVNAETDPYDGIKEMVNGLMSKEILLDIGEDGVTIHKEGGSGSYFDVLDFMQRKRMVDRTDAKILEKFYNEGDASAQYLMSGERERLKEIDKKILQPLALLLGGEFEIKSEAKLTGDRKYKGTITITPPEVDKLMKKYKISVDEAQAILNSKESDTPIVREQSDDSIIYDDD